MELLARIDESEVAATFVRGELESPRFREDVLAGRRGSRARELFDGLPTDLEWNGHHSTQRGARHPLHQLGLVAPGVERHAIRRRGRSADLRRHDLGIDGESHLPIVERLRSGAPLPELIAEGREGDPLVLVEGHARLTAFALYPECLPDVLHVLVGFSERVDDWWAY